MSSEGFGESLLLSRSTKSRMETVEVCDLNDVETRQFLKFKGVPDVFLDESTENGKEMAEIVENITGGRVYLLERLATWIAVRNPLSQFREDFLRHGEIDS